MAGASVEKAVESGSAGNGFLSRDDLLKAASSRNEETLDVPGLGRILVGEIGGDDRATITSRQAQAYQENRIDIGSYQKSLLKVGVLDHTSPPDARLPLLRPADVDAVMKLGAGKVKSIVDAIERLSGMDAAALTRAEGNSLPTASASSTSS